MRWQSLSHQPYPSLSVDIFYLLHYHTIVGMFHICTNAKVTDFTSFCTFVITNKVLYPILLFPLLSHSKLLPIWNVTDRQIEGQNSSPLVPKVFFSLSVHGSTRRRNSTGLAEPWDGWPSELEKLACEFKFRE